MYAYVESILMCTTNLLPYPFTSMDVITRLVVPLKIHGAVISSGTTKVNYSP